MTIGSAPRRARARRGEGDRLRPEILAAAGRLLAERGDENAVSIRMIADAVGVTPPSIYLHFPDKDALIEAVCEERFAAFDAALEEAAASHDDPLEALRARGRAYVRFALDNPEHYRVIFMTRHDRAMDLAELVSPGPESRAGAKAFAHLVAAVERAAGAGAIAAPNPVLTALHLWAAFHGLASLLISEPGFPWPDLDLLVESLLDLQEQGMRART
ncbi:MAG TPA: TetR/AcrR family transcriptional regulator [Frankiaceae bacterium]|nr:TetR/AcrR family transcriptional regulator [Frankiaceae bacterium]